MEYSANLQPQVDFDGLSRAIHTTGIATGLFELGAVRVRAIKCDHYAVADLLPQNSFIDTSIRIGLGRSQADKERLGEAINTTMNEFLAAQLSQPYFALSIEVREINTPLSWKTNAIHPRIRNAAKVSSPDKGNI